MARSASDLLPDTPVVERSPAQNRFESPHLCDNERKHRTGVPIKRNQRLYLQLPVAVYTLSPDKKPDKKADKKPELLLETARSAVIYPSGCVLHLGAAVELGQELLLVNPQNNVQAACRVAGFESESKKNGVQPLVRLEFTQLVPKFWGVMFPPEHGDPAERKLPRLPRRSRRIDASQPIQVCQIDESSSETKDVCITRNISPDGLYFEAGHLTYREGMRLTISFLRHSDFFAANATCTGQIVRVESIEDGRIGVAVKLLGKSVKARAIPFPSRSERLVKGAGQGPAVVPNHPGRSLQSTANQANALGRICATSAKLCKDAIGVWRKRAAEVVRSSYSALSALTAHTSNPDPQPSFPLDSDSGDEAVANLRGLEGLASLNPEPDES